MGVCMCGGGGGGGGVEGVIDGHIETKLKFWPSTNLE